MLLRTHIRKKINKTTAPGTEYSGGEALVFWVADWLNSNKLLLYEQLYLFVDEFADVLIRLGNDIEKSMLDTAKRDLPYSRVAFLDRKIACMDGSAKVLNLITGEVQQSRPKVLPLEIISYNLTGLYVRYHKQMKDLVLQNKGSESTSGKES